MKSSAKQPLYFSAYPLKAIGSAAPAGPSPYLRSILSGKSKQAGRGRIFPMANPYALKNAMPAPRRMKPAKGVEGSGAEWYHHYE